MNSWPVGKVNILIVLYAAAMAWVEAAVVLYLRTIVGQMNPFPPPMQPMPAKLLSAELVRELSTLIMLASVGWLAGRRFVERVGRFLIAFGMWDLLYYVFLRILTGFPRSLLEWDILFLLPLPWWGPVYAPCSVSLLMIVSGWLLTLKPVAQGVVLPRRYTLIGCCVGILLVLFTFMEDSIVALAKDPNSLVHLVPERFQHLLFWVGWVLMALPCIDLLTGVRLQMAGK